MSKIREVRISFERLLKVWLSKLDANEEELVEEDLIWFNSIFENFFIGDNLSEYIDKEDRYNERKFDDFDLSGILEESVEFSSNIPMNFDHLKLEKPDLFDYYRQLNEKSNFYTSTYNLIDIYFRTFKKLYTFSVKKDLGNTKKIIRYFLTIITEKISIFEKEGFNSSSLLTDFYYVVLWNLMTEKEISEEKPDSDFISTSLFKSTFFVYYKSIFHYSKAPLARKYLLNIWKKINQIGNKKLLDEFLNSLAEMTLSNSTFREVNLSDIRGLLQLEDYNSDFYRNLDFIKSKGGQVIFSKDIEEFNEFIIEAIQVKIPEYIPKNIVDHFLKSEEETAIALYKFREIQSMVLEYLGLAMHFKGKKYFLKSISRLRRNEQWSNHHNFFPKSMHDLVLWLIFLKDLKFQMSGRFEPAFGYGYLNHIIIYLFKGFKFQGSILKQSLVSMALEYDSGFLESMRSVSNEIFEDINRIELVEESKKESLRAFWESLVSWFIVQIGESEVHTPIQQNVFDNLKSGIWSFYKDRSLLFFLSQNLDEFIRMEKSQYEFKTSVVASDLTPRKYLIPGWYSPGYGLTDSIGRYLVKEEIMQFEYKMFSKQSQYHKEKITKELINGLIEEFGKTSLFIFRNSFPDFWLRGITTNIDSSQINSGPYLPPIFTYNTSDRISELIIIPRKALAIKYIFDGRLSTMSFLNKTLMWELIDLGGSNTLTEEFNDFIINYHKNSGKSEEDLNKFLWIRFIAKSKVVVKDKNSILRYKLNPYDE